MRASNPKLADLDLDLILTPAATLRPGAAQRCIQRQVRPPGLPHADVEL